MSVVRLSTHPVAPAGSVIPAKAGIHSGLRLLVTVDPGVRRGDASGEEFHRRPTR